jgi:hypothetical protein
MKAFKFACVRIPIAFCAHKSRKWGTCIGVWILM